MKQYRWAIQCCQVHCQNSMLQCSSDSSGLTLTSCSWSIHTFLPCFNAEMKQKLKFVFQKKRICPSPPLQSERCLDVRWPVEYEAFKSNTYSFSSASVSLSLLQSFATDRMPLCKRRSPSPLSWSSSKVKFHTEVPSPTFGSRGTTVSQTLTTPTVTYSNSQSGIVNRIRISHKKLNRDKNRTSFSN